MAKASNFPSTPISRISAPLSRFLHMQAAGGIALFAATIVALLVANTGMADGYREFWNREFYLGVGSLSLRYPLWYWVNDGLMTLFFFLIGLEVKREIVHGELRDPRNIVLPAAGAVGGALVPIGIFLLLAGTSAEREGWAVPMATDIAFVVGCLALLGDRVPAGLKIFMLSLAIIDDILAVTVIALVFTGSVSGIWLGCAAAGFAVIAILNKIGVRRISVYLLFGAVIWLCTLKGGVHPTVAGALLGIMTPASAWLSKKHLRTSIDRTEEVLEVEGAEPQRHRDAMYELSIAATESVSPLARLESGLHPWIGFVVMPIFALANANVAVSASAFGESIAYAIAVSLVVGKPLGILLFCALAVWLGVGRRPQNTSWTALAGGGALAGIGFTMALFVSSLSVAPELAQSAKVGILGGSAVSLILGMSILLMFLPNPKSRKDEA